MANRVQIVWKWKRAHLPKGERNRWQFIAHGAPYERESAERSAELIRSHGKVVRFLPLSSSDE